MNTENELCRWGSLDGHCENGIIRRARHTVHEDSGDVRVCSYCLIIYYTEEDNETIFNNVELTDIDGADLHRVWGYDTLQNQDGRVVWGR